MANVCTPREGTIHKPSPGANLASSRPISPRKRDQWVLATATRAATSVPRVRLNACPNGRVVGISKLEFFVDEWALSGPSLALASGLTESPPDLRSQR